MIDREMVEEMFANMKNDGIDANAELLWGYYFVGDDAEKLNSVVPLLEKEGFEFVEIFEESEEDDDDDEELEDEVDDDIEADLDSYFVLHIERVEAHTVDSLDQRNQELHAFAEQHGIGVYDGMDVGRADGEPFE